MNFDNLLGGGDKEVPEIYNNARLAGYKVVELMWTKYKRKRTSTAQIKCAEVIDSRSFSRGFDMDSIDVKLKSGTVRFYTDDKSGYNFGYMVYTDANKERLARSLGLDWYRIVDQDILKEVEELAIRMGLPTSVQKRPDHIVKKSHREKEIENKKVKVEQENRELKAELMKLKDALKEKDKNNPLVTPPLSGVKLSKEVRDKSKEVNLEDLE